MPSAKKATIFVESYTELGNIPDIIFGYLGPSGQSPPTAIFKYHKNFENLPK